MTRVNERLAKELEKRPVVYVAKDIERALGLPLDTPGYYIATNDSQMAQKLRVIHENKVYLSPPDVDGSMKSTRMLLRDPELISFIKNIEGASILVFKNSASIENVATEAGLTILNPSAKLVEVGENKLKHDNWLGRKANLMPPHKTTTTDQLQWKGEPFILQWEHGHSGAGTIYVEDERHLGKIKKQFPVRPCKISKYIDGPTFTNNNVPTKDGFLLGNVSYQITGLPPIAESAFETIGNDWALPHKILSKEQLADYERIAGEIVEQGRMKILGFSMGPRWQGLFGIDMVLDKETGKLYLIEVNARQPASVVVESQFQRVARGKGAEGITIFEAHLMDLLDMEIKEDLIKIDNGARLQDRSSGMLDIPSPVGIMREHEEWNEAGEMLTKEL